jgi:hypothetical protein
MITEKGLKFLDDFRTFRQEKPDERFFEYTDA